VPSAIDLVEHPESLPLREDELVDLLAFLSAFGREMT
jgi:hypothetical protein